MFTETIFVRMLCLLSVFLIIGCQAAPVSREMSGEVGKSLVTFAEMEALAERRLAETKIFLKTLHGANGNALQPRELVVYKTNSQKFTKDVGDYAALVCAEKSFPQISEAVLLISDINKSIGKLAESPTDTFAGINKAVRRDEKVLQKLTSLQGLNDRVNKQIKEKSAADDKLLKDGKDCGSIVKVALNRSFIGAQPVGGDVSLSSALGFFEALGSLAKAVYGIKEEKLRESALRAFAAAYEEDVLYSLMLIDGRMNILSLNSTAKPSDLFKSEVKDSDNRLMKMLEQHQGAMLQRGFLIFSDLTNSLTLSNAERIRSSEDLYSIIAEARNIESSNGPLLTAALTKLWTAYFETLKNGSNSKTESLDAIIQAESVLSGLLSKFKGVKKALADL
jgi:hypothetical protein